MLQTISMKPIIITRIFKTKAITPCYGKVFKFMRSVLLDLNLTSYQSKIES